MGYAFSPALVRIACVVLTKQEICPGCSLVSASRHESQVLEALTSGLKTSEHPPKFSLCTKVCAFNRSEIRAFA